MKNIVNLILGIAIAGTGIVLVKLIFQPQTMVQEVAQPQTTPQAGENKPAVQNGTTQLVEVGNKHCPVTGREIGQMGPGVKHEYKGKIYNLCCGMCPRTFDSDPARYAKIAEDETASQNKT